MAAAEEMKPGQLAPNAFETAIVRHLVRQEPATAGYIQRLHVLSRTFTGVGCFTQFQCDEAAAALPKRPLRLNAVIRMPGVPDGMGATLFYRGFQPECLEVYTFGDARWDGEFNGFFIEHAE